MIFAIFAALTVNLLLRFNEFVPAIQDFPVVQVAVPILLVLWLAFGKKDFSFSTDVLIPLFFCVAVAGYGWVVWPGGIVQVARDFFPWMAIYFLAANLVTTPRRMDIMLTIMVACALVLVLHSAQQLYSYDGADDTSGTGFSGQWIFKGRIRYIGILADPNDLALFFVMALGIAVQFVAMGPALRMTGYVLCVPLVYGLFLANSRGGMLAAAVVAASFMFRRWGKGTTVVLCAALACLALAFGPSRLREQTDADEESTEGRIEAWYYGVQDFASRPLLGIGKDQFTEYNPRTAHNSFVLCFAETGIAGYVPWLGAGYLALCGLYHVLQRTRPGTRTYRQTAALFDALSGFYVGGFFLSRTYFIILPLFLGLAVAQYKAAVREWKEAEEASRTAREHLQPDEDAWGDFLPGEPFPDLSWHRLGALAPRLVSLAVLSIVGVYVIVKLKMA